MIRNVLSVLLCFVLLAGCSSGGSAAPSSGTESGSSPESLLPLHALNTNNATAASTHTETVGQVSFEISSLWTPDVVDDTNVYYRYFDENQNYEAFMLAFFGEVDYSQYGSVKEALVMASDASEIEGAEVQFTKMVYLNGIECMQTEVISKDENGSMLTDMYFVPSADGITCISCSQLMNASQDYSREFAEILQTITVSEGAPVSSSSNSSAPISSGTTTGSDALYSQTDYTLSCYERNDGVVACDAMLEITNVGSTPIWLNDECYFDIYNESGSVIASCSKGNIDLIPEVILPGERGYYCTMKGIELPGGYFTGYEYELGGEINPAKASYTPHDYPVEVISILDDGGQPSVLGYVTNDTTHDYPNIQLYAIYYSNASTPGETRPEGAAHDYLGKLEPGKRSPFSLPGSLTQRNSSFSLVCDYTVIAREAYNPN